MSETAWTAIGVIVALMIVVGGPAGCAVVQHQQAAETIKVVCAGEMDAGRALFCDRLTRKMGMGGS